TSPAEEPMSGRRLSWACTTVPRPRARAMAQASVAMGRTGTPVAGSPAAYRLGQARGEPALTPAAPRAAALQAGAGNVAARPPHSPPANPEDDHVRHHPLHRRPVRLLRGRQEPAQEPQRRLARGPGRPGPGRAR